MRGSFLEKLFIVMDDKGLLHKAVLTYSNPSTRECCNAVVPTVTTTVFPEFQPNSCVVEVNQFTSSNTLPLFASSVPKPLILSARDDLASTVIGVSLTDQDLFWDKRFQRTLIGIICLGAAAPELLQFVFADCSFGQFPYAFPVPCWLDYWRCIGYWCCVPVFGLFCSVLQKSLVIMVFQEPTTVAVFAMAFAFIAGVSSWLTTGLGRSIWLDLPRWITLTLFFPLVKFGDALPGELRLLVLRYVGPCVCAVLGGGIAMLHLPAAENRLPGTLLWTVAGVEVITNVKVVVRSAIFLFVLLSNGIFRSWRTPDKAAFIFTTITTELP